ncbi:MAG: hypothetical protein LC808_23935, partial [Actinobacteria bacterium]|nr:hypothetical protein [Actinomycetota bacterium]
MLLGYVVRRGVGSAGLSRNTESKYERLLKRTGMAIPPELVEGVSDGSWSVALDFQHGIEQVRRVA